MLEYKALGPKTKDAQHEVKWVITRQNGKPLGYVKSKVVDAFVAAMNAPTPREQELEAQNKALWELVEQCDKALQYGANDLEAEINHRYEPLQPDVYKGVFAKYAADMAIVQQMRLTLAAIQKAKEAI
jgi:hypothetical protein